MTMTALLAVVVLAGVSPCSGAPCDDATLAALTPDGWQVSGRWIGELDGRPPAELAVIMSECKATSGTDVTDWWVHYGGVSRVLILNNEDADAGVLASFEFNGCAPPAGTAPSVEPPFYCKDLDGDGVVELFVRTHSSGGGSSHWVHINTIKWWNGAYRRAGTYGIAKGGGLFYLDVLDANVGREAILLNYVKDAAGNHTGPAKYRVQVYGWANGWYSLIKDFTTSSQYSTPQPAFDNLRRFLWKK
jgi:hypothetical protein